MNLIDRWREWITAFDQCTADNHWQRLEPYLAVDVVYGVQGVPYACEVRGRQAVIAAFSKSINGFDRKFDERRWMGVGIKVWEPGAITGRATGWYRLGEHAPMTFSAQSAWIFKGDQLSLMTDIYDSSEADVQLALGMLAQLGSAFNPSYV
jgi:hypothetical protein